MSAVEEAFALLLVGMLIWLSLLIHWGLRRSSVPALVGYLLLGFLLSVMNAPWQFLTETMMVRLDFLADIGVAVLLFRVGIDSNLAGLLEQLRKARLIWLGNVLISGGVGYLTAYFLLQYSLLTSLYVAVALTATSVGVTVALWRDSGALESPNGQMLVDVAEMDDISAVLLMSILLAVTPTLANGTTDALLGTLLEAGGLVLLKLLILAGFCYTFSRFAEHRLTLLYERMQPMPDPMLMLAATGLVIAALAGLVGFSIAIGAFFAGLIFSRDPEAVTLTKPFTVLYDLFTPFFFISIGLHIEPQAVTSATVAGLVLLTAAVIGKIIGTAGPALRVVGWNGALLLGVSMIPRAEIAMILMRQGQQHEASPIDANAYSAMVFVSAATCIIAPLLLRPMLTRWEQHPHINSVDASKEHVAPTNVAR